jgi:hypothetical protein
MFAFKYITQPSPVLSISWGIASVVVVSLRDGYRAKPDHRGPGVSLPGAGARLVGFHSTPARRGSADAEAELATRQGRDRLERES